MDNPAGHTDYIRQSYLNYSKNKKAWANDGKAKVYIIGDSYSQDLFNTLREVELIEKLDVMLRFVKVRCGVLFIDKSDIKNVEFIDNATKRYDVKVYDFMQFIDRHGIRP